MGIEAVQPAFREVAASALPQISLTRRERELQVDEGVPPLEIAEAEQEALRWRRRKDDLQEKWRKRQRKSDVNPWIECSKAGDGETPELREEEETGTVFDSRS